MTVEKAEKAQLLAASRAAYAAAQEAKAKEMAHRKREQPLVDPAAHGGIKKRGRPKYIDSLMSSKKNEWSEEDDDRLCLGMSTLSGT